MVTLLKPKWKQNEHLQSLPKADLYLKETLDSMGRKIFIVFLFLFFWELSKFCFQIKSVNFLEFVKKKGKIFS